MLKRPPPTSHSVNEMFLCEIVSTLKPTVGMVVTISSSFSSVNMVSRLGCMLQRCQHYKELWSFRRSRARSLRLLAASQEESKVMKGRKRAYLLVAEQASEELRCRAAHYCTETTVDETVLRTKTGCHQSASYRTRSRTQTTSSAALHTSLP